MFKRLNAWRFDGKVVEVLGLVGGKVDVRLASGRLMHVPTSWVSPIDATAKKAKLVNFGGNLVATMAF